MRRYFRWLLQPAKFTNLHAIVILDLILYRLIDKLQ